MRLDEVAGKWRFQMKKIFVMIFILSAIFVVTIYGLEVEYLQEDIEMLIIEATAKTNDLEQKLISLEYTKDAINRGNNSAEKIIKIIHTLEFLYMDAIENYRDVSDFIQVREKVAMYLGNISAVEAENVLILILQNDDEEIVLVNALISLGKIGINESGETITNIVLCFNRNQFIDGLLSPNIALATIDALGNIARRNNIMLDPDAMGILSFISLEARYERSIRETAMVEYEYWLFIINNYKRKLLEE